jgi:hypothetical protein
MDTEPRGVTGVTEHGVDVDRGPRVVGDAGDGEPGPEAVVLPEAGEPRREDAREPGGAHAGRQAAEGASPYVLGDPRLFRLARGVVDARSWAELRRAAEPAVRDLLGATRVTLALTEAYLAPHLDLTTPPPLGPLLRVPLESGGRTLGVLEVTAPDADRLTAARPAAEQVAALVAARLADLRRPQRGEPGQRHHTLAETLDALPVPVAVTATTDGAQVWRNRAYLVAPPPAVDGPDVVVAVGDLAVAAWGPPQATETLRAVLDEALTTPDAVAILRPDHDPDGAVADFEVAWSNRPRPELAGAPLETSVRAATRRIGPGKVDLFAQLVEALHRQAPADLRALFSFSSAADSTCSSSPTLMRYGSLVSSRVRR